MKKIFAAIICLLLFALTSCKGGGSNAEMPSELILAPSTGYRYIYRTDCGTGLLHKKDCFLWYYDYESGVDIPLCSNPSCSHNNDSCYAYFPTWTFTYNNVFYLYSHEYEWSEDEGFIYQTLITAADLGSQTRREALWLDYETTGAYAYGDKLFLVCRDGYYLDGDILWANPDRGRVYMMEISLDTMEVSYQSECLADGLFANAQLWGVFDGELYFRISWYDEYDESIPLIDQPATNRYVKYDLTTHDITDSSVGEKFTFAISGDCMITYDNCTTSFVTPDKTCELISEVATTGAPVFPWIKANNEVYFTVYGNASSIFKYDLADEKLYEAEYDGLNDDWLVAVPTDGYVFAAENDEIYTVKKEDIQFSEIDGDRYNEVCENYNAAP